MIVINSKHYRNKLEASYYNMVLQENVDYFNTHGKGPYEYNGRFANRVLPYLDAGYWHGFVKWLKKEYNITYDSGTDQYIFDTEEEVTWFMLRNS